MLRCPSRPAQITLLRNLPFQIWVPLRMEAVQSVGNLFQCLTAFTLRNCSVTVSHVAACLILIVYFHYVSL